MNRSIFMSLLVINILSLIGISRSEGNITGLSKIFDDRLATLNTLGDPHGGLPDDIPSLVKYCANFVTSGLYVIGHMGVRYPMKFLMKAIMSTGILGFIKTNAQYCMNPLTMTAFTQKARLVNSHNDRLSEIREELKKRLIYAVDKVKQKDKQKYSCCAFHDYKRKSIEEVPEATDFLKSFFRGYFKLCEIVYCHQYQEGSAECQNVDFFDEEPSRPIGRSWFLHVVELFAQYI